MELLDLNEEHGAMDEDASMMFEEHIVPATTDVIEYDGIGCVH
nr:hypothetical protein Itr_chr15CG12750 [Ipomoea trifida]